ncbi:MAG: FAD-dependent oxidoreductase [Bacteroidota bacterium]
MAEQNQHIATEGNTCVIVGASHGGVNAAFALRKAGWEGQIQLIDSDPRLPYHRPPLSKAYLMAGDEKQALLKPEASYQKANVQLRLGETVLRLDREAKQIHLVQGEPQSYDALILATGARPFLPPISGLDQVKNQFVLRTAEDAAQIRAAASTTGDKRVVIIGGGYIGLEVAASLRTLGAEVCLLEREDRILARVTAPELSDFVETYHRQQGVAIHTSQQITQVVPQGAGCEVHTASGNNYVADVLVVGCGILVNQSLAEEAGLVVGDGIQVDAACRTSDPNIFAIGDCSWHHNPQYDRWLRLESVQNAADQAKVAAAAICGKEAKYDAIPWFWSDQFDLKLQMVGLSQGYDQLTIRRDPEKETSLSLWYFRGEELLAVDAVNQPKAYVLGTRFLRNRQLVNQQMLADTSVPLHPKYLLVS